MTKTNTSVRHYICGVVGLISWHLFKCPAYLVPERKLLIFPISASGLNFNPRNTPCIPVVKIYAFLKLEKIF